MKRFLGILFLAVMVAVSTGCSDWLHRNDPEKRMVLLYIAATETSLSTFAEGNISDMLANYVPDKKSKTEELLVFFQNRNTTSTTLRSQGTLCRYYKNKSGNIIQETITTFGDDFNACDPASFAKVLAAAEHECKPTYRSLLFSSHGTGWLPASYFDGGGESSIKRASIGYDAYTKDEIDIRDLAEVLGKYHWEAALLDCCYMGAVEVAYQLRNCCDWIIASPTEILITGFPYNVILDQLFNHPGREGLEYICEQYYNMYQSQSGTQQSGTIGLVDCSKLDALANICATIVSESRAEMEAVQRNGVQHFFYNSTKDYFYDLSHFYQKFATTDRFAQFSIQLEKAVPYKNTTDHFLGIKMQHFCGLSTYVPSPNYPKLNEYYSQLAWNQAVKVIE